MGMIVGVKKVVVEMGVGVTSCLRMPLDGC